MSTEIAKPMSPMEEFQENLKKSLRDDIARMLPEAAVAEMIKRVIEEEFFTKRVIDDPTDSGWNKRKITKGTVFQDIVMEHAKPILRELASQWMADNALLIAEQWKAITDAGLMQYVESLQREIATAALRHQLNGWFQKLNEERRNKGLPDLMMPMF